MATLAATACSQSFSPGTQPTVSWPASPPGHRTAPDEDTTSGQVSMMSMHRAKGLEFTHVFLPAWEAHVVPSQYGDYEEERRLAYVALTARHAPG